MPADTTKPIPTPPAVRPVKRLDDLRVVLDPPSYVGWMARRRGDEAWAKALNEWAKEIEDFLRDHRSQDPVSISVERVEATVCDQCGQSWEVIDIEGEPGCAYCGVAVATEEARNA